LDNDFDIFGTILVSETADVTKPFTLGLYRQASRRARVIQNHPEADRLLITGLMVGDSHANEDSALTAPGRRLPNGVAAVQPTRLAENQATEEG
jgi:hypothetical protein